MKKLALALLFISASLSSVGQDIPIDLPNLSPQSPEAFQFTKYGEVQVNESTGVISPSIPLYVYRAGDLEIPIVLSYSGNGVKVSQDATWVGMNWNLSPGGVITREVRDEIDEKTTNRKFYSKTELDQLPGANNYFDTTTQWYQELLTIGTPSNDLDTEADIFNYNFMGYSGSFYLDYPSGGGAPVAHLMHYNKELKITFSYTANNISEIFITTPNGDIYSFGGATASESSKTEVISDPGVNELDDYAQNAFYLHRIVRYNNDVINFNYDTTIDPGTTGIKTYDIGQRENLRRKENVLATTYNNYTNNNMVVHIERKVFLSSITSSRGYGSVEFNYDFLLNEQGNQDKRRAQLNQVLIKREDGSLHKRFDLVYDDFGNQTEFHPSDNRFFLTQVNFMDSHGVKIHDYQMEYNNPGGLPEKFSFGQDYNGYYNGKDGPLENTTLLPKNSMFNDMMTLADREASAQHLPYGSLSKITYPTGGHTKFTYELPIKNANTLATERQYMNVYLNDTISGGDDLLELLLYNNVDDTFALTAGQQISVDMLVTVIGDYFQGHYVTLTAEKGGQVMASHTIDLQENALNTTRIFDESPTLSIPETGSYLFRLLIDLKDSFQFATDDLIIYANTTLHLPTQDINYEYYPSLRIKKVESLEAVGADPIITRYYYNTREDITEDQNSIFKQPSFVYENFQRESGEIVKYLNLSTTSTNNTSTVDTGNILYKYVTISYGGDNFENGGKQIQHRVYDQIPPLSYFAAEMHNNYGSNTASFANSTPLNEVYFSWEEDPLNPGNNIFIDQKKVIYTYSYLSNAERKHCIKSQRKITGTGSQPDIRDWEFGLYDVSSNTWVLTGTTTIDYFNQGAKSVTTDESLFYTNYKDRPHRSITTNSDNEVFERVFYYPKDIDGQGTLQGFTSAEESSILLMHGQNKIDMPYMVQEYEGENTARTLMSSRQMVFSDPGGDGQFWPQYVRVAKANDVGVLDAYTTVIHFKEYGPNGDLLEAALIDRDNGTDLMYGSITKYIYNAKRQPILKIEGYDPDFIVDDNLSGPCMNQEQRPLSHVTSYEYDPQTGNLIKIIDPRCYSTTFEYDAANRLERVRDDEGKLLSENQYNYVTQSQQ